MRSANEQVNPVPSGSTFNDLTIPLSITIENLFERKPPSGGRSIPKSTDFVNAPAGSANMRIFPLALNWLPHADMTNGSLTLTQTISEIPLAFNSFSFSM